MSEEIIKVLDELGKRFGIVIDWSNQNSIRNRIDNRKRVWNYQKRMYARNGSI